MVKFKRMILLSVALLIILSFNVYAFGVSSPYWDENPLIMNPGETKEITMVLQNMVGQDDIVMTAKLNSGNEIATLLDENAIYNVPLGVSNVPVNLKISIPQNVQSGQEWQVGISFKTVAENAGGVSIGGAIDKGFKVKVAEPPKVSAEVSKTKQSPVTLTGFIILVAVLIILVLIIKYFYKSKEHTK